MPFPLIPLITAVGSLAGPILQYKGQKDANRMNMKLAQNAQNFEIEQQKLQNDYNSPASQMERYRAAGLNPRLMYGTGGGASAGNQQSRPQPHVADVKNVFDKIELPFLQMLTQYQDYKNKIETEGLIKTQKDLNFQRAVTEGINQQLGKLGVSIKGVEAERKPEIIQTQLDYQKSQTSKVQQDIQEGLWRLKEQNPQLIAKLKLENTKLGFENTYNQVLRELGIDINSPWYVKFGSQVFNAVKDEIKIGVPYVGGAIIEKLTK